MTLLCQKKNMSNLYTDIFDQKRLSLFNSLSELIEKDWLLGGGTALALQINHRKSYDFDVFLPKQVPQKLLAKINQELSKYKVRPTVNTSGELSVLVDEEMKLTFVKFPFPSLHKPIKTQTINLFSLSDLASNKIYVIGRRGEWKDYVDLYFLLKKTNLKLNKIIKEAQKRFGGNFDEKLFWEQLVYWGDLKDFKIEYIKKSIAKESVQKYFKNLAFNRFS